MICEFCGYDFPDHLGRYGCPNCEASDMTTNAATYLGHLPNGNPVQRHSADALYAQFGAVIFAIERAGTIAWNCLYRGNIIATAPKHSDCQALARIYLEG